jgi:hypothetical protein
MPDTGRLCLCKMQTGRTGGVHTSPPGAVMCLQYWRFGPRSRTLLVRFERLPLVLAAAAHFRRLSVRYS